MHHSNSLNNLHHSNSLNNLKEYIESLRFNAEAFPTHPELIWHVTNYFLQVLDEETLEAFLKTARKVRWVSPHGVDWIVQCVLCKYGHEDLLKVVQASIELSR